MDPTHPATQDRIRYFLDRFKNQGYKFIKLDFMTHGALEGSHYKSDYTGIQAYNEGLAYICDRLGGQMFINFSIAPLFPANYAHSRRIACDAFSKINETEYTLNSTTYGWWLDHVYSYNDADHVVLHDASEGENRARVTSSAITGIFTLGDDFSNNGSGTGKDRAKRFLTNREINRMAQQTKAFRPVKSGDRSETAELFYAKAADTTYVAILNYSGNTKNHTINFSSLGLNSATTYTVKELWSNESSTHSGSWSGSVNGKDAKVLKIYVACTDCPEPPEPPEPPITSEDVIANFEDGECGKSLGSISVDQNISSYSVVSNPDKTGLDRTEKTLYLQTNDQTLSGEAQYKSGITLNFPQFNTSDRRYMHFAFKTNTEKVEFLINGNWDAKFNPRTQVSGNGWFDYVLDLGTNTNVSQITILFDMRTGDNCDTSAPINDSYNNHNKYMYIDEIEANNNSTPRSLLTFNCGTSFATPVSETWKVFTDNGQIVVTVPDAEVVKGSKINVYNMSGRKIAEQAVTGSKTLVGTRLAAGIYLVKWLQTGSVQTKKVPVY
jgi:hypothetical protein